MRSFYLMFSKLQIGQAILDQFNLTDESTIPFYPNLSWLHYERLLRVKDADARLWYLKEAAREQWDYRTLQRNISSQYYYRLLQTTQLYIKVIESYGIFKSTIRLKLMRSLVCLHRMKVLDKTKITDLSNKFCSLG